MRTRGTLLGLVLALGVVHPAHAESTPAPEPPIASATTPSPSPTPRETIAFSAPTFSAAFGTTGRLTGAIALSPDETAAPTVVVQRQTGATWTTVASTRSGRVFVAMVPAEAATYRAVLTVGGRTTTSAPATFTMTPAPSALALAMPAALKDGQRATWSVTWNRTDTAPTVPAVVTGTVALDFKRTGTTVWKRYGSVVVQNGVGSVTGRPRDDGEFRVRHLGSPQYAATSSASARFDNQPTKPLALRFGQYNLPGPDKLRSSSTRVARAAALVRKANLDVVVLNELVGPGRNSLTNKPSSFATSVRKALGPSWAVVTPTTAYNENYIFYRTDRIALIQQNPDRIVPSVKKRSSGRHVTTALLKDLRSNRPLLVAGTHLVNDYRAGARAQSKTVAAEAKARSFGYPTIVSGDMNTSENLAALNGIGLKDARRSAARKSGATYSTYTRYTAKKPRKDSYWIIDQVYVPRTWSVTSWTTVMETSKGRFVKNRSSDHPLVWLTVTGT